MFWWHVFGQFEIIYTESCLCGIPGLSFWDWPFFLWGILILFGYSPTDNHRNPVQQLEAKISSQMKNHHFEFCPELYWIIQIAYSIHFHSSKKNCLSLLLLILSSMFLILASIDSFSIYSRCTSTTERTEQNWNNKKIISWWDFKDLKSSIFKLFFFFFFFVDWIYEKTYYYHFYYLSIPLHPSEFFIPILTDGFSLELKWQQGLFAVFWPILMS